jgi:hypothetical protein
MKNDGLQSYRDWAKTLFAQQSEGLLIEDHIDQIEENVAEELQEAGLSYDLAWEVIATIND